MGSYLSRTSSLLSQQDSMREFIHIQGPAVSADSRYSGVSYQFYNPVQLGKQPPQSYLDHVSEYGT